MTSGSGRRGDLAMAPPRSRTFLQISPRILSFASLASRAQNERNFRRWEELPDRGRRYIREFVGRAGGRARYIKEVDANETTIRFAQEIYDAAGKLIEVHEKFPVDLGHKQL